MGDSSGNVLSYPGPLTRAGIIVAHTAPDRIIITIPSRFFLPTTPKRASIIAACLMALLLIGRYLFDSFYMQLAATIGNFAALAILMCAALARPSSIRLENGMLHVDYPRTNNHRHLPFPAIPLNAIYRIYYVGHAGAIFVRAHGHEMVDIAIDHPAPVAIELEKLLNQLILGREPVDLSKPDSAV